MCGRYYRRSDKQRIAEALHLGKLPDGFTLPPWDYSVAPTTFQPVIRQNHDAGDRELVVMRWGLIQFFAESLDQYKDLSTINARSSTLWRDRRGASLSSAIVALFLPMASTNGLRLAKPSHPPTTQPQQIGPGIFSVSPSALINGLHIGKIVVVVEAEALHNPTPCILRFAGNR
jgi:hypothetical protein